MAWGPVARRVWLQPQALFLASRAQGGLPRPGGGCPWGVGGLVFLASAPLLQPAHPWAPWGRVGGGPCHEIWAWSGSGGRHLGQVVRVASTCPCPCTVEPAACPGPACLATEDTRGQTPGLGCAGREQRLGLGCGTVGPFCPGWQGPWSRLPPALCLLVPRLAQPSPVTCPLGCLPVGSAPKCTATASPTLKALSCNWQFCHIYSQQIGLSGARWGSPEACREIGLKRRVRVFSLC